MSQATSPPRAAPTAMPMLKDIGSMQPSSISVSRAQRRREPEHDQRPVEVIAPEIGSYVVIISVFRHGASMVSDQGDEASFLSSRRASRQAKGTAMSAMAVKRYRLHPECEMYHSLNRAWKT